MNIKRICLFAGVSVICVISIALGIYAQYMSKYNNASDVLFGNVLNLSDEENDAYQKLEDNFQNIFTNKLESQVTEIGIGKRTESKDLVYTLYNFVEKGNKYDIDMQLPALNLNAPQITQCNTKIEELFKGKAESLAQDTTQNSIYSVKYVAYVNSNILSLVIKATLKEGQNPQRIMIQTYNYDLNTGDLVSLEKMLTAKKVSLVSANTKIQNKIKTSQEKADKFKETGYSVFSRNVNDPMYKIENTNNYFFDKEANLYLVYAYGNSNYTTDMDMVIF